MSINKHFVEFVIKMLPMPVEKAETISTFFEEITFTKGDILIREAEICDQYYFLLEGVTRSCLFDLDNNEVTTGFYKNNEIVCDLLSFFKRIPSKESYVALSDGTALAITFNKVQEAFHGMPEFREFGRTMLVNAYAQLKTRMISSLQDSAEDRYLKLIRTNSEIFHHAPLKHIASYLGITDTSLSRIRKESVNK